MAEIWGKGEQDVIKDVLCDKCKLSTKSSIGNFEFAKLESFWGYGSKKDGEHHKTILCERCYDLTLEKAGLTPVITESM